MLIDKSELNAHKKVLIIQNKFVGDVLASASIAKNIKQIAPQWTVDFFCYHPAVPVIENNPFIDAIIAFDDRQLKSIATLYRFAKTIRKKEYDIIIDPYSKLQSGFITAFSKAPIKISYDKPFFRKIYTNTVVRHRCSQKYHCLALENRLGLLEPLFGKQNLDWSFSLQASDEYKKNGNQLLKSAGHEPHHGLIMIGIFGSSELKTWTLEYMAELVEFIQKNTDFQIVFNYTGNQQQQAQKFYDSLSSKSRILFPFFGKTIPEFLGILSHCQAYIGNEGGGTNMAKALNVPTFTIFSPHKFPEDWGCFEKNGWHQSVHLRQLEPELYIKPNLNKYEEKADYYFRKLSSTFVIKQLKLFMNQNFNLDLELEPVAETYQTKVSALLITKNEERNIPLYLAEAEQYADEIIVVDSGSTDNTEELCKAHPKVRFFVREFDNYTNQKNYAISLANHSWATFFDADERLPHGLISEIQSIIKSNQAADAYYCFRNFFLKEHHIRFSGWQNDKAIRLFRTDKAQYSPARYVHEILEIDGKCDELKNRLDHYSFSSKKEYAEKLDFYSKLKAKELHKLNVKPNWFHHRIKPTFRFLHHYVFRYGFLDGSKGLELAQLHAESVKKRYDYLQDLYS